MTKALALIVGVAATGWAIWLFGGGSGLDVTVIGIRVRSNEWDRALVVGATAWIVFFRLGGRLPDLPALVRGLATVLALGVVAVGVYYSTTAVGGSDSYGYASEAELILSGKLRVPQPWARSVPWPDSDLTFTPLGFRPVAVPGEPDRVWVPIYPPGLPLLMAVGKLLGGQEGLFWVVPVSGGVLVLTTYLLGAVLATPAAGLIGAWLVATSPAMLFSLVAPMSDVPAAAAFSLTLYLLTISSRRRAVLAGLVAGLAFLIRPNLAICVMPLPLRYFFDRQASAAERWKLAALFALGVVPSLVFLMGFNSRMYGSMWETGYGSAEAFFATAHFWPNTKTYISHLIEVQTPLFLIGLAALAIPARRIWSSMDRGIRFAILVSHIVLWLFYCFYLHFEAWWYLRFLLPIWATVMVGTGAILVAATRPLGSFVRLAAIVGLGLLGVHFVKDANNRNVFVLWNGDRLHYVASASMVNEMTEKSSVIYSMQHSGSLRYYTGRVTLRYDVLDPAWLDKSVAWFVSQGVHPYLLIAEWERPTVLERFAGQQTLALLKQPPVFVNRNASDVSLYDLSPGPVSRKTVDRHGPFEGFRSVPPVEIREDALSLR